jgi:hypothetical protein
MIETTCTLPQLDDRHAIADARVVVRYEEYPPEPDVGYPYGYLEIDEIVSVKGRPIRRILAAYKEAGIDLDRSLTAEIAGL